MVARAGGDTRTVEERSDFGAAPAADGPTSVNVSPLEDRITRAAMRCVARWGIAKTTLDDVAREARCSRATVYRVFPGGKDVVFLAAGAHEANRCFAEIETQLADATTLEDALVAGMVGAASAIRDHPALQYLIEHEPETVLPFVAFDGLDPVLVRAALLAGPHLSRFVDDRTARELVARLVVAYGFDATSPLDLTRPETARRIVATYVLAGCRDEAAPDRARSAVLTTIANPHP